MDSAIFGIPVIPETYYDKEIKDCHYCKECDDIIPLSRKNIGLCKDCEPSSFEGMSIGDVGRAFKKFNKIKQNL